MMGLLTEIFTPALGIAISPLPIVGLILILLGKNAKQNSLFFSLGWLLGNLSTFAIAIFFMDVTKNENGQVGGVQRIIFLILGSLLILMSIKTFMGRTKVGEEPDTPKWFEKMTSLKVGGAISFGAALAAVNPKNLLLSISAGVSAGGITQTLSEDVLAIVLFVLVAASTIVIPTVLFLIKGDKIKDKLDEMKTWLIHNNDTITSVMLLFIGLKVLGKIF